MFAAFQMQKITDVGRPTYSQDRREGGGRRGHCPGARGHRGTRGSELSGLECKIHQLKLRAR